MSRLLDFENEKDGTILNPSGMIHLLHCLKDYFLKTKFYTPDGQRHIKTNGIPNDSYFTPLVSSICTAVVIHYLCLKMTEKVPNDIICCESYSLLTCNKKWDLDQICKFASEIGFEVNIEKSICTCDISALKIPNIKYKN